MLKSLYRAVRIVSMLKEDEKFQQLAKDSPDNAEALGQAMRSIVLVRKI